jgi:hypothetical protein
MLHRLLTGTLAVALGLAVAAAHAFEDANYPDWKGSWTAMGGGNYDPSKPRGLGQQAPLKPEFQKLLEASLADQEKGGQGDDPGYRCTPHGMPRVMLALVPIQFVIMPETTYVMLERLSQVRRIYTDGRAWPTRLPGSSLGYSIGKWVDEDGDGRYDTLEVETRGITGPRSYDSTGMPFHPDNATIVKERISLDKANPSRLRDEITTIDNALTRPWTVDKRYTRNADLKAQWPEFICNEFNGQVMIGEEHYYLSGEGMLMPARKDQPPPDLRYFKKTQQ